MANLIKKAEDTATESFQAHPVLTLLLGAGAAVLGKKEYDRRYHTRAGKKKAEEDE